MAANSCDPTADMEGANPWSHRAWHWVPSLCLSFLQLCRCSATHGIPCGKQTISTRTYNSGCAVSGVRWTEAH
eukprot:264641-Amphidinium_carterae.2